MSDHNPDGETEQHTTNEPQADTPPAGWPRRLVGYWSGLVELDAYSADATPNYRDVGVTSNDFADADVGSTNNRSNASRNLKKLADDETVPVRRKADGNAYYYWLDLSDATASNTGATASNTGATGDATRETPAADDGGLIARLGETPNHADAVPSGVPEFMDPSDILLTLRSLTTEKARKKGDTPTSARLIGHTGAGKSHVVRYLAQEQNAALVTLQCEEGTDATDIAGESVPVDGQWLFRDGRVTEAFRLSHDGLTILLIDEFNRMRPEAAAAVMAALGRGEIDLPERGETVRADPSNIVIIGTMNPPEADYQVFEEDFAQGRRWGSTKRVPYLGVGFFGRAVDVVGRESPDVTEAFCELAVDAANELRAYADADGDPSAMSGAVDPARDVVRPVPTGAVKELVDKADLLAEVGHPDAALAAAEDTILNTVYLQSNARDWIAQRLTDRFSGVDPHTFAGESGDAHTPHKNGDVGPTGGEQ